MQDKRIVIPENIGTSIKLNFKTEGKYDVNVKAPLNIATNGEVGISLLSDHFSVDSKGNLTASPLATALRTEIQNNKPQLSKTSGNLLQQFDDGLYYGITAPANVSNLFVDVQNGVDQDPNVVKGAGTRANPLKTVAFAMSLIPANTRSTINLKEQQRHVLKTTEKLQKFKEIGLIFRPYGERVDYWVQNTASSNVHQYRTADLGAKATLVFEFDESRVRNDPTIYANTPLCANNLGCEMLGLIIETVDTFTGPVSYPVERAVFGSRDLPTIVKLAGCIFRGQSIYPLVFSNKLTEVILDATFLESGELIWSNQGSNQVLTYLSNPLGAYKVQNRETYESSEVATGKGDAKMRLIGYNELSDVKQFLTGSNKRNTKCYYDLGLLE